MLRSSVVLDAVDKFPVDGMLKVCRTLAGPQRYAYFSGGKTDTVARISYDTSELTQLLSSPSCILVLFERTLNIAFDGLIFAIKTDFINSFAYCFMKDRCVILVFV